MSTPTEIKCGKAIFKDDHDERIRIRTNNFQRRKGINEKQKTKRKKKRKETKKGKDRKEDWLCEVISSTLVYNGEGNVYAEAQVVWARLCLVQVIALRQVEKDL